MSAQQSAAVRQQVYQALDDLPISGLEELVQFIDYLKHKYKSKQKQRSKKIVSLKGLWADVPFPDITDEDIRDLRKQVGLQILRKVA